MRQDAGEKTTSPGQSKPALRDVVNRAGICGGPARVDTGPIKAPKTCGCRCKAGHRGGCQDCCGRAGQLRFRLGGRQRLPSRADTGRAWRRMPRACPATRNLLIWPTVAALPAPAPRPRSGLTGIAAIFEMAILGKARLLTRLPSCTGVLNVYLHIKHIRLAACPAAAFRD
jgi:hypothetical protein